MLSNTLHTHNSEFCIFLAEANSRYKIWPVSSVQLEKYYKEKPPACCSFMFVPGEGNIYSYSKVWGLQLSVWQSTVQSAFNIHTKKDFTPILKLFKNAADLLPISKFIVLQS